MRILIFKCEAKILINFGLQKCVDLMDADITLMYTLIFAHLYMHSYVVPYENVKIMYNVILNY